MAIDDRLPAAVDASGSTAAKTAPRARMVPRLALTPAEAAESIGMSVDTFDRHVRGELRVVRRGAKVLVPVAELEAWLDREAARTVGESWLG